MPKNSKAAYSYSVTYSPEDDAYLAECLELGIFAHGDTQEEAIKEVKEATAVHLLMLEEDGENIPAPLSSKKKMKPKSKALPVYLDAVERKKVELLSVQWGVSLSSVIKRLIREYPSSTSQK